MRGGTLFLLLLLVSGGVGFYLYWNSEAQQSARRSRRMQQSLASGAGLDWIDPEGLVTRFQVARDASRFELGVEESSKTRLLCYRESNGDPGWQEGETLVSEFSTGGSPWLLTSDGYESTVSEVSLMVEQRAPGLPVERLIAAPPIRLAAPARPQWHLLAQRQGGLEVSWRRQGKSLEMRFKTAAPGHQVDVVTQDGTVFAPVRVGEDQIVRVPLNHFPSTVSRLRTTVRVTRLASTAEQEPPGRSYRIELLPRRF